MSPADSASCGCAGPGGLLMPEATFSTFILSLASSCLVHLGEVPDPATGQEQPDLTLAKHTIDVLCMLKCKTEKGLDADEKKLIEDVLYELRLKYVAKSA